MPRKLTAILILSTALLGACASIAPQTETANEQASAARKYQEAITLAGRLSVQYQKDDKDEAIHGSFTWKQNKDRSSIAILSPLGQILATIEVTPDNATLIQSGQAPRSAADVDLLVKQTLGWPLPVSGLRSWLQGFANGSSNKEFMATANNNKVTTRDGWNIQYPTWESNQQTPAQERPKRIDLERQTEQAGKVAIRIVLDSWQTP
ncbi:outer membrane lipoprotein LolB [Herminiimonas sp. KBW02]|uniref:lipoprotein insertase outer membrane protein LolB n=1 Tax=Herminiimonas sp. KBW02 TaxID=2153363 RepID=UPI000F597E16|nr:lipoprotein insertase outer membrane protein LolB [Herminiimonas sp. KBW02]RQO34831.1 outer membrane lipoprotein LolB [Herminiimonas sp. KBW02]